MTFIITISSREGIVLGADTRISRQLDEKRWEFKDQEKIVQMSNGMVGTAYWGLAEITLEGTRSPMNKYLEHFDKEIVKRKDDIHNIASKLQETLQNITPPITRHMGVHLSGYAENDEGLYPVIRHVFHQSWHSPGEFVNEYSNQEYHQWDGTKIPFSYDPWRALFNGANFLPQIFFNNMGSLPFGLDRQIIIDKLTLKECEELTTLLIETTGKLLKYMYQTQGIVKKVPQIVKGVSLASITKDKGFMRLQ